MDGTRQHGEDRKALKGSRLRRGTVQKLAGARSDHERCPKCKKLRQRWLRANAHHPDRKSWERIEEGKSKVCHICVARHRGEALPLVHGAEPRLLK